MSKSNTTANATFSGTRTIDIVVVMVAGLFFANMIMKPVNSEETIQVFAAEVAQDVNALD